MNPKIRYKSQGILLVVLVTVALVLLNYVASRYFVRWDLTEDKEYTLSQATKKIVGALDDRITIKLFFTKNIPARLSPVIAQVEDLLEEYRAFSKGQVVLERINPDESPQKEQETQMLGIPPLQINVIEQDKAEVRKVYLGMALYYADKHEVIPVISDPRHMEYDLTSSILRLTEEKRPVVGLLLPPVDKQDYAVLAQVLDKQVELRELAYDSTKLKDLDLNALLLVAPQNLPPAFTSELDSLLNKGIPVIILADKIEVGANLAATKIETGLDSWLKDKGIEMTDSLIVDPQYAGRAAFSSGMVQYHIPYPFFINVPHQGLASENPITAQLENIVLPWANGLEVQAEGHPDWNYHILASSSVSAFLHEADLGITPQVLNQMEISQGKKYPLALLAENSQENKTGVLLVVANTDFVKSQFLNDFESNILLVQNMIDWATRGQDLIGIRSRGKTSRPLAALSGQTTNLIRWTLILTVPLLLFFFGFLVKFLHRKRLAQLKSEIL